MDIYYTCKCGRSFNVNFNLRFSTDDTGDIICFDESEIHLKIHIKDCETNGEYTRTSILCPNLSLSLYIDTQKISKSCVSILFDCMLKFIDNYCCGNKYCDLIKNINKLIESISKGLSKLIKQNLLVNECSSDR